MPLPLPVETLEYILQLVVAFPDLMNTSSPQYSMCPKNFLPLEDIKLSTRSLFSLALVCKQWNTICTPVLYQCLVVDDYTTTDLLLRTLEHPWVTTDPLGRFQPLGSLTRHLIIALSDQPARENLDDRLDIRVVRRFGNLGRLARCLPCLQTLSISITIQKSLWGLPMPYYGKDFAAAITQTSAQSLQKLYLHKNPILLFTRPELYNLLELAPNLAAVVGSGCTDLINCPVALPYLPKLTHLTVTNEVGQCDSSMHQDNRIPSLEHVHIRPSPSSNFWLHLLSAQGPGLTSISLDLRVTEAPENRSDCLSMLSSLCPNLSRLEIFIDDWHSFPRADWFPSIEYLDIRILFGISTVADICKTLATIQLRSLRVIRLMDPQMIEWFAESHSSNAESAWSPLIGCPFRVVDCHGRELGPSVRPS
jgi:F-box-like